MSLDIVLGYIPGASEELRADLERAVTDSNTQECTHD